jgi:5-(carboxyamino)imidazole ribonucleotide mutase
MDALLSTAQMPGGIPVACVAIGKAGAKNAGWLAAQMLAISDADIAARIKTAREKNAAEVIAKNDGLMDKLKG